MYQHTDNLIAEKQEVKPFYVYIHRRADDGRVFYVGKGKGNRATRSGKSRRNPHWHNVVNKHGFTAHIVMRFHREECALSFEVALIKHYGFDNLVNKTTGGEGVSGLVTPQSVRDKISASLMGRFKGNDNPNFGMKLSDEVRKKISLATSGKNHRYYGKKIPPEVSAKISASNKGKVKTKETRDNISKARKGKMTGSDHHQYDCQIHIFAHSLHGIVECTRYELMKAHDLQSGNLSAMMNGRRNQCGGWSLIGKKPRDAD